MVATNNAFLVTTFQDASPGFPLPRSPLLPQSSLTVGALSPGAGVHCVVAVHGHEPVVAAVLLAVLLDEQVGVCAGGSPAGVAPLVAEPLRGHRRAQARR